jgi:hypothetical protein
MRDDGRVIVVEMVIREDRKPHFDKMRERPPH